MVGHTTSGKALTGLELKLCLSLTSGKRLLYCIEGGRVEKRAGLLQASTSGQTQEDVVSLIFPITSSRLPHTYPRPPEAGIQ